MARAAVIAVSPIVVRCFMCHTGGGRFFQHFLMAPLDRAVPFKQVNCITVIIAEDLDLYVPGFFQVFLKQHPVIIECSMRFPLCRAQCYAEIFCPVHYPHAPAAASC